MMKQFSDEQKIHVTAKLVQEMLGYCVDQPEMFFVKGAVAGVGADEEQRAMMCNALRDALYILQSPLLRVKTMMTSKADLFVRNTHCRWAREIKRVTGMMKI